MGRSPQEQQASRAKQRFKTLAKLDASTPLRKELARSKVPPSTIASLYPFDFADLIDGLIPLVGPQGLSDIVNDGTLEVLETNLQEATNRIGTEVFDLLHASHTPELDKKITQLAIATMRHLPEQEAEDDFESKKETAKLLVTLLWHATFYMAHVDKGEVPLWWTYKNFIDITDLLFAEQFAPKEASAWS